MMKVRCCFIAAILMFFSGNSVWAQLNLDTVINRFENAFKLKDASLLKDELSDRFAVGIYTKPTSVKMLQTVFEHYQSIDSFTVLKVDSTVKEKKKIQLHIYCKNKKEAITAAYLDKDNRLLYIDLCDQLYGINKYNKSKLRAVIPFKFVNSAIVVELKLNNSDKVLNFLFDTGADGMAINQSLADSLGLIVSRKQQTSVVGAQMEVQISSGNIVHLDTLHVPDQNIAIFSKMSSTYDGIIGINLARRYITKVNFDNLTISLYDFGDYKYERQGETLDLSVPAGIPILNGTVDVADGKKIDGTFVFDTGAGYYFIAFGPFVKKNLLLTSGFNVDFSGVTLSMGHSSPSFTGNINAFCLGNQCLKNFPGTLQAYRPGDENWMQDGSGSIGIKLLSRFNFTLNLPEHTVHLTPNKSYKYPFDFVLGNLMLGFDPDRQLRVKQILSMEGEEGGKFEKGDVITAINDVQANALFKQSEEIDKLKALPENAILSVEYMRDGMSMKENLSRKM
ncbi:retropepsin-like aspartic protease [Chitinophagaceae bacterium LWZ2-11]